MTRTRKTLVAAVAVAAFLAIASTPASAKDTTFKSKSYYQQMESNCAGLEGDFSEDDEGNRACDYDDGSYTLCEPDGDCVYHSPNRVVVRPTVPSMPIGAVRAG